MAQTYKMMLGTSGKQWEQLTVKDDGTMTMTFHGTDREICHEVTENADGWLCYPGGMFPGLESGKWLLTEEEPIVTVATNCVPHSDLQVREPQHTEQAQTQPTEQPTISHDCNATLSERESLTVNQPARPKRQRKARKTAAPARRSIETSRQRDIETQKPTTGNEWLLSAGYLAAATVALLVIYETGLLIPLGLIGLATSGLLK